MSQAEGGKAGRWKVYTEEEESTNLWRCRRTVVLEQVSQEGRGEEEEEEEGVEEE
jgi:hypothetical protein